MREVAEAMVALVPGCDVLAGMEMGGFLSPRDVVADGLPTVFVRKHAKEYGTGKAAEGGPVDGRRVVMIEDIVTTGGALPAIVPHLRAKSAQVDMVVCAMLLQEGGRILKQ